MTPEPSMGARRATAPLAFPLRLPRPVLACVFGVEVLATTELVLARAWKEAVDPFLYIWAELTGGSFVPFGSVDDVARVAGIPFEVGIHAVLASRGIGLAEGPGGRVAGQATATRIDAALRQLVAKLIAAGELRAYPGSTRLLRTLRSTGIHTAAVSTDCAAGPVLEACGLGLLVEVIVDADELDGPRSAGMPLFDVLEAVCWHLGLAPDDIAVVVGAGRLRDQQWGRFGVVVGVDHGGRVGRTGSTDADLTVTDLGELVRQ